MTRPRLSARRATQLDRWAPWALAGGLTTVLFALAMLRVRTFGAGYDIGYFRQAAFLISEGRDPYITIRGLPLLADHLYLLFFPVGWLTRALPDIGTLLGLQAAALGFGAVPLYAIARRHARLGAAPAAALLVAYACYPALHNVNLFEFHPEVLAVPTLFGAVLFALDRRWIPYGLCIAVILLSREDLAFVVIGLALLLALDGHRRAALLTFVAAVVWFGIALKLLAHFGQGEVIQASLRLPHYGSTSGEIVRFVLTHPHTVLGDLLTVQSFELVLALVGPLLFLPLFAPKYLLPGIPLQTIYLLTNQEIAHTIDAHYPTAFIPFAFVAAAFALAKLLTATAPATATETTTAPTHATARSRRWSPSAAALLVVAAPFFYLHYTTLPIEGFRAWASRDDVDAARAEAVRLIPNGASVASSHVFLPELADRVELFTYPRPFGDAAGLVADPVSIGERQAGVTHLIVDSRELGTVYGPLDAEVLRLAQDELGFRPVFERNGISVYRRGS